MDIFNPTIQGKWNWEAHRYEPHPVPETATIVLISDDMDLQINCANCFKGMTFGVGYTSKTIHNHTGFGFPVCEDCYEKEVDDEQKAKLASH